MTAGGKPPAEPSELAPAHVGRGRRRRRLVVATAGLVVIAAVAAVGATLGRAATTATVVRLVVAGDMACDPHDPDLSPDGAGSPDASRPRPGTVGARQASGDPCRHDSVARLAVGLRPDLVLGLGDYQHETQTAAAYRDVYEPSWGRLRDITVPVFGNQEYTVANARTFVDYFGDRVVDERGYWSQEVGSWHLVVLNSNCASVGGCGDGSAQQQWLETDLAGAHGCVLAAWHHPRWSNGIGGPNERTGALFRTLYRHGVELVLSGHDADYERFGPLDPDGRRDANGVRQFVVGTGGQARYRPTPADTPWRGKITAPGSEFADYDHHGVLELELRPGRWRWSFHTIDADVVDQGEGSCT